MSILSPECKVLFFHISAETNEIEMLFPLLKPAFSCYRNACRLISWRKANAMTTVYFIRHAQADSAVLDQESRPLTDKGKQDCYQLAEDFENIKIDFILSSPYRRSLDTIAQIAERPGLSVHISDHLRGLRLQSNWIETYRSFFLNYWNDFTYHYADGESFAELQQRCISLLQEVVGRNSNKTIVISTHSVSMAVMLKYYDASFDFEDFMVIAETEPFVVKLVFDEKGRVNRSRNWLAQNK